MAGEQPTPRPPQQYARGERRSRDSQWLTYLAAGGDAGNGMSLVTDQRFVGGIDQFNEGGYFQAHALFEHAWLIAPYPDRLLCLALSKLGAAFEHQARGNLRGARKVVNDAQRCLGPLPAAYGSIDVQALRQQLETWSAAHGKPPAIQRVASD
ncbi:MAG: DUF309 domain-containing protein [Chloroflexi bacterium]|nr:DUF309 domain-containing protein [Chloroflexota bacterium]